MDIIIIKGIGKVIIEGLHLSIHYDCGRVMNEFDLLAYAADAEYKEAKKIISFLDMLIPAENYTYNILRSQVYENQCLWKEKDRRRISPGMIKTYLMVDSKTGATKIGSSVNPPKRESTLQSEKREIKLIMVCDKNIEKELHKKFECRHIRGEWYNLNEKDINNLVEIYGFYPYKK